MSGTRAGGVKAAATNKERHGSDFYAKIGHKGGLIGITGGFAARTVCDCAVIQGKHHLANCAGRKGGIISRRTKK